MEVRCEACSTIMRDWDIGNGNILSLCPECGHIIRDLGRCNAGARDHAYGGSESYDKLRNNLTYRRIVKLLKKRGIPAKDVFELGFGGGHILRRFLDHGLNISGVERNMLDIDIDPEVKKNGKLYFFEAEKLEYPAESRDLVYGIHLAEHLDNPEAVFRDGYKTLRPGGMIYLITPAGDSAGLKRFGDAWWNLEDPTHIRFFSADSISRMLTRAGFKDIRVGRPVWDSMTLEIHSLIRKWGRRTKKGAFGGKLVPLIDLLLLPWAMTARALFPKFRSSLEVSAVK